MLAIVDSSWLTITPQAGRWSSRSRQSGSSASGTTAAGSPPAHTRRRGRHRPSACMDDRPAIPAGRSHARRQPRPGSTWPSSASAVPAAMSPADGPATTITPTRVPQRLAGERRLGQSEVDDRSVSRSDDAITASSRFAHVLGRCRSVQRIFGSRRRISGRARPGRLTERTITVAITTTPSSSSDRSNLAVPPRPQLSGACSTSRTQRTTASSPSAARGSLPPFDRPVRWSTSPPACRDGRWVTPAVRGHRRRSHPGAAAVR